MTPKRAPRKRAKSKPETNHDFDEAFAKNFNCANIQLKKQLPLTDNQKRCYYITQKEDTNIVFINGVAGSAKTYIAVYSAMELLKERKVDQIIYIRSVVESSSRSIGALPGELEDKFSVYTMPLVDKLNEIIDVSTQKSLLEQEYIRAIPVNFVRGLTFNNAVVIIDEAQNMSKSELTTILTRFGRHTRYFVCGDSKQSDIKDSGFEAIVEKFDTPFSTKNHIYCEKFDITDVVRSPILKHIAQVLGV
jgi:phosphate starvation-inducible PhoH-like protein